MLLLENSILKQYEFPENCTSCFLTLTARDLIPQTLVQMLNKILEVGCREVFRYILNFAVT